MELFHDNRGSMHRETGAAWNVAAGIYERDEEADVAFLRSGGVSLLQPERRYLHDLGSWCSRAVHLQCAGGRDTLSLGNLGAREVVGVDIGPRMIASAERKAAALRAPAAWYCCDVLETPQELDSSADLVYTGKGALPWIMDLREWAQRAAQLLRPGGRLYLFEGHPLDWVWELEAAEYRPDIVRGGYFAAAPRQDRWPAPVVERETEPGSRPPQATERQWTLGEIVTCLSDTGLRLVRLEEHPELYWDQFPNLRPDLAPLLPHTFSLWMERPV